MAVIENGGIETVFGSDVAAQINDGGYQYVWGTATGAIAFESRGTSCCAWRRGD